MGVNELVRHFDFTGCLIIVNDLRFICTLPKLVDLVKHHLLEPNIVCNVHDSHFIHFINKILFQNGYHLLFFCLHSN